MPAITGLSVAQTRLANTEFARTFFPRALRSIWPRVCGTTKSSAPVEPFTFLGAAPMVKLYNGNMTAQGMASFTIQVPNPVWKNIEVFKRDQFEFDQTRVLGSRVGQLGVKVAQHWDYLLANRILKASTSGSQTITFQGASYTTTLDNQPLFSLTHNTGDSTVTQKNIITGHLPTTIASLNAQDLTVSANQMQLDIAALINQIATVVDDKGALVYPDFDPARQLIVMVPPALWAAAELAFRTQGTLGGTNGSSSGSTSNIGYRMIKDLISFNLLAGCPDVESNVPGKTVAPVNATEYYCFIDGDFVRPWYFQRFLPIKKGETMPLGEDPEAEAAKAVAAANANGIQIRPEDAEVYAATEIDHNLGALGAKAQESVVTKEEFFVSARTRGQIFPGPWYTAWKIDPTTTSN